MRSVPGGRGSAQADPSQSNQRHADFQSSESRVRREKVEERERALSVRYATFDRAALPPMDAALTNDPSTYPAPEVRARLHATQMRSLEDNRVENRIWTRFRTGQ